MKYIVLPNPLGTVIKVKVLAASIKWLPTVVISPPSVVPELVFEKLREPVLSVNDVVPEYILPLVLSTVIIC